MTAIFLFISLKKNETKQNCQALNENVKLTTKGRQMGQLTGYGDFPVDPKISFCALAQKHRISCRCLLFLLQAHQSASSDMHLKIINRVPLAFTQ